MNINVLTILLFICWTFVEFYLRNNKQPINYGCVFSKFMDLLSKTGSP